VFPVRYGQTYRVEFEIKDRTMGNVQNCDNCTVKRPDFGDALKRGRF
jgi:hypothetical protein